MAVNYFEHKSQELPNYSTKLQYKIILFTYLLTYILNFSILNFSIIQAAYNYSF